MRILVRDFMKQPVASLALPNDVGTVRDLMHQKDCHAIPLVEVGENQEVKVRGIATSDDLVGVYDDTIDIRQVMSKNIFAVAPETGAREAAEMMLRNQVHHLLVMDGERVVGILSSLDFVRLVAERETW